MAIFQTILSQLKLIYYDYDLKTYLKLNNSPLVKHNNGGRFVAYKHCLVKLGAQSEIYLNSDLCFGVKQMRGSKMESRLFLEEYAKLVVSKKSLVYSGTYIRIMHGGKLILDGCSINENVQITCGDEIYIGEGTNIGRGVVIRSYDSHVFEKHGLKKADHIRIGKNVWIGQNVIIYKGVTIGDNVIVGAGNIILEDIPSNTIFGKLK